MVFLKHQEKRLSEQGRDFERVVFGIGGDQGGVKFALENGHDQPRRHVLDESERRFWHRRPGQRQRKWHEIGRERWNDAETQWPEHRIAACFGAGNQLV